MKPSQIFSEETNFLFLDFFSCQLHCLLENFQLNIDVSEPLDFLVVCYEDFELEMIRKEAGRGVIETLSWLLPGAAEKGKTSG
jgi:hypothetical protein